MESGNILETGMYFVDKNYRITALNSVIKEWYPDVNIGALCYKSIALLDSPCEICPLKRDHVLFYATERKEWINSNAALVDMPQIGECYCIQFTRQSHHGGTKTEEIQLEKIDDYIRQLTGTLTGKESVLASYCETGSPIYYANEQMVSLLGYSSLNELISATNGLVVNLMHPDDRIQVKNDMKGVDVLKNNFEFSSRMRKKDGSWIWVMSTRMSIKSRSGRLVSFCVNNDISNFLKLYNSINLKNQEYLQEKLMYDKIAQSMPSGYHRGSVDNDYRLTFLSDSFLDIIGWTAEELENELENKYINIVYPADRDKFRSLEKELIREGHISAVYRIHRKDGNIRWIQDNTIRIEQNGESFYQCTMADITEYVEQLNEEKQRAEACSRAKSTFLFNASHDIRTPMNAIQGFTKILKENLDNRDIVNESIRKIEKSSETLSQLLNDVLELSRIESGKDELDLQIYHLNQLGKELYEIFSVDMKDCGIDFKVEGKMEHTNVFCDTLKLSRIGINMLSNAKKFTPKGGSVIFGAEEIGFDGSNVTYRFYAKDTGIGMSKEFQKKAFEQFERERTATDSGVSGCGLGLAIIKKLVTLMGGTCDINSELGKGTEISVTITFKIADNNNDSVNKIDYDSVNMDGKRVLLVEDNECNREIARYILEELNLEVDEAENGYEAVNKLMNSDDDYYDLVFMDIQMPIMDGYTATQEIRCMENPVISSIPILAMTANAFHEDKEKCLEVGMNGHIAKPIDTKKMIAEMLKYI